MRTPQKAADARSSSGFTLLEMMIALSLVSLITVIVAGSLHLGVRTWEKSESVVDLQQRSRIVLTRLKQQLGAAVDPQNENSDGRLTAFKGDMRSVEYVTSVALDPANKYGWVHVRYQVDAGPDGRNRLLIFERNLAWLQAGPVSLDGGRDGQAGSVELVGGFEDLHFEYLHADTDKEVTNWVSSWRADAKNRLPEAIRITYREEDAPAIRVIARTAAGV